MRQSFSVIIPAYNAESYIREAIDSAFNQTLAPHEIIVVDDGSTDATMSIVQSYGAPVRLLRQENAGPGAARNYGASMASGNWLAFLDADDVWELTKLERQSETISESTGVVYTDRINVGEIGGLSIRQSDAVQLHSGKIFDALVVQGNFITLSSACIERQLFGQLGGFNPEPIVAGVEDWELWLRAAKSLDVALVNVPLVRYRSHAGGISKDIAKMFAAQEVVLDRVLIDSPTLTRKKARTSSAMISAWFSLNAGQYVQAIRLYARSLRFSPGNIHAWKGLAKSCIGKR